MFKRPRHKPLQRANTREEAEEAVRLAHDIFRLVRSKIAILLEVK
jgi:hypothetical protein